MTLRSVSTKAWFPPPRWATYHGWPMAVRDYETIFVGGGLAAMLLLRELGSELSGRVAVIDPCPPPERPTVHWSYWSHVPTLYDRFAVGSWRKARVAQMPAEPIAPYTTENHAHRVAPCLGPFSRAPGQWNVRGHHGRRRDACRLGVR